MGMTIEGELVTRIKGLKMRSDVIVRGETMTTIIELDAGRFTTLRPAQRVAEVWDMKAAAAPLAAIAASSVTMKVTPSGRKETRQGQSCEEYLVDMRVNVAPPPSEPLTLIMKGPVWLAPAAPGRADWTRFYTAAADKGLFFNDPRSATADPARTRGLTLLFKRLAQIGMLFESSIQITFEGQGRMADAVQRMGVSTMTNAVSRISADPVADDVFVIPADYTVSKR